MKKLLLMAVVVSFLGVGRRALGAVMLDMGPTAGISSPANSPAHAVGTIPASQTTWNTVFNTNLAAGSVLNSDGTVAAGVSVTIGQGSGTAGTTDFTSPSIATNLTGTSAAALGTDYNGTAAADGIFKSGAGGGSTTASVGVRVDGLAAGTYTIYGVLRNTNTANNTSPESLYAAAAPSATSFTFSALTPSNVANSEASGNSTWIAGDQYATAVVTLAAGQSLYVIANGATGSAETRGMMDAIQIVPEPAAGSLAVVALAFGCARRRHRVSQGV